MSDTFGQKVYLEELHSVKKNNYATGNVFPFT